MIRGVELSAKDYPNFHTLGYGFRDGDTELARLCEKFRAGRDERKYKIVGFLCMNLMRIKKILRTEYDVFFASSGVEALDTMKREQMDLVLLDIEMPRMNGFETFERMKEFAPDTPVIFLTASGQEDDVVSAIRLGAVNYLKKPFPPQELILRISQVLEKR